MKKVKLNDRTIRALSRPNHSAWHGGRNEVFVWDADLPGFGLRMRRHTDGSLVRTWVIQYRFQGRSRRIRLDRYERLAPKEARKAAQQKLQLIAFDRDPQAEREAKRRETRQSFRAVVHDYLAARKSGEGCKKLRPTSFAMTELYLTGDYYQPLHGRSLGAITPDEVSSCTKAIERKHSKPTAATARRHLSTFFAWTITERLLRSGGNPVDGSYLPEDPKPRDRVLTDTELVAVWNACDGDDDHSKIVRLLILTAARRGEIGGMTWDEVDGGKWTLPAVRSKNGRKHEMALPPAALDIIHSVPRQAGRDHLFGDRAAAGFRNWYSGKQALERRLGNSVKKPFVIHDIRRTVATGMANIDVEPHIIEAVLNHYSGHRAGMGGVYNLAKYPGQMKSALSRWANHVAALVEGRDDSNVVAMPLHA
jgi:integrase